MQGMLDNAVVIWLLLTAAALSLAFAGHAALFRLLCRFGQNSPLTRVLVEESRKPVLALALTIAVRATALRPELSEGFSGLIRHAIALVLIACVAWLATRVGSVLMQAAMERQQVQIRDNQRARKVRTQLIVLRRLLSVSIWVLAGAAMLTTFTEVRALGASILASAGVIGIVAGVAAQSTVANLVAGIQIALTEPIRLDDVVIVEEEWGRIEEITLSYVVVRLWDMRRLVLPVSYFVNTPFQNWTRTGAQLIGSVYLYTDYTVPMEELRTEFERLLRTTDKWDGKASSLQVTDATENTLQLRATMSAADAPTAWDLRCYVREGLVSFLQERYPGSLPRVRTDIRRSMKAA